MPCKTNQGREKVEVTNNSFRENILRVTKKQNLELIGFRIN